MLTPYFLAHFSDEYLPLSDELDEAITRDIARRLVKAGEMTSSALSQSRIVQESGKVYDDIIADVAKYTGKSQKQVRAMFKAAGLASVSYDTIIYEAAGLTPLALAKSEKATKVLTAGVAKTNGFIKNLTKTTAAAGQDIFIRAATVMEMKVESGAFDTTTALRQAIKDAADSGKYIVYDSGHRDTLDVAMRRCLQTGVNQTTAEISLAYASDMGCDLVEVSAHIGARPTHAEWQGRVYSLSGNTPSYDNFRDATGYGTGDGLCGWNCRHSFMPFFEGSKRGYTDQTLEDMKNRTVEYNGQTMSYYDATQKQRAMERAMRSTKREFNAYDAAMQASTDPVSKKALLDQRNAIADKLKQQRSVYSKFSTETGLGVQNNRALVSGFGHSSATKAVWGARAYEIPKLTNADGTPIIEVKSTSLNAAPNSITQRTGAKGNVDRNYYDSDGKQYKQISSTGHGNKNDEKFGTHGEHAHDYVYNSDRELISRESRDMNEQERKENFDIL